MKKYTMDDFISKKLAVLVSKKNINDFLSMCEHRGLKWASGDKPTKWKPRCRDVYIMCDTVGSEIRIFYREQNQDRFGYKDVSFADIIQDKLRWSSYNCLCEVKGVPEKKNRYQIIIDCDGKITTARMLVDGKEVRMAQAKRNPADKFDWKTGAKTAFDRLWIKKTADKKPAKEPGVFKVGDRVVFNEESMYDGEHGIIITVSKHEMYGVRLDEEQAAAHDLGGRTQNHHGYWARSCALRHE